MTFKVERCWAGSSHYWRVSHRSGRPAPFQVGHNKCGERWHRGVAREAKDYLSYFFGLRRRNIRFYHP